MRELISGLRGQILGLRWQISGLRGQISGLRGLGGDGQTNGQTKVPLCSTGHYPFGAAALLPLTPIHNQAKQGNEYR